MAGIERDKLIRIPVKVLKLVAKASDFTDGGATVGTYTATKTLPAGAMVIGIKAQTTAGFSGDTTASVLVGKAAATDDYSGPALTGFAAAQSKFGTPATIAEQGPAAAATAPLITVTTATDFTLVVATGGRIIVDIFYHDLTAKPF